MLRGVLVYKSTYSAIVNKAPGGGIRHKTVSELQLSLDPKGFTPHKISKTSVNPVATFNSRLVGLDECKHWLLARVIRCMPQLPALALIEGLDFELSALSTSFRVL